MSAIGWPTILTAIQDLFQAGSGLADTRVLFQRNSQRVNRPDGTGAWIVLKFKGFVTIGRPYTIEEVDTGSPAPGEEIINRTVSMSRITFEATCFPPEVEDDATTAYALLTDCIHEAFTPGRQLALKNAGIGLLKFEPMLPLDGNIGGRFEPRATVMFGFTATGEKLTKNGYIEHVNIEVDLVDKEGDVVKTFNFTEDLTG